MHADIARATQRLQRSAKLLEYRRLNWRVETNHRIRWEFESFARSARAAGLPFQLQVMQDDSPNDMVIQIRAGRQSTGAFQPLRRTLLESEPPRGPPVFETGGELVASQCLRGYVNFIIHPRKSDYITPHLDALLILRPYDPAEVTPRLVRRALRSYLLVLRDSTTAGGPDALTLAERLQVMWLHAREARAWAGFLRSLLTMRNEWGKLIVAGVIGGLAAYWAASP